METGNGTAGDGDKQDGEQILSIHVEACKSIQVAGRICNKDTNDSSHDHKDQKIAVQIVSGLEKCPYRSNTGYHNIQKNNDMPYTAGKIYRESKAQCNGSHQHNNGNGGVYPFVHMGIFKKQSQSNSFQNKQHGGGGYCSVSGNCADHTGIIGDKTVKGTGNHVCESGYHQNAEQPAEQEKQFFTGLSDIFLDDIAYGAAFIFNRCIHGSKILHRPEKYTADQDP